MQLSLRTLISWLLAVQRLSTRLIDSVTVSKSAWIKSSMTTKAPFTNTTLKPSDTFVFCLAAITCLPSRALASKQYWSDTKSTRTLTKHYTTCSTNSGNTFLRIISKSSTLPILVSCTNGSMIWMKKTTCAWIHLQANALKTTSSFWAEFQLCKTRPCSVLTRSSPSPKTVH